MKGCLKIAVGLVLAMTVAATTVFAEISSIAVENTQVTVQGKTQASTNYFFTVFKPGYDRSALTDSSAAQWTASVGSGVSDANGDFSSSFMLDDSINKSLTSGAYTVRVTAAGSGEPMWGSFFYLASAEIPALLKQFNEADATTMETLTEQYQTFLDVDTETALASVKNPDTVYEMMVKQAKAEPYTSLSDVALAFNRSVFMTAFYEAETDAQAKTLLAAQAEEVQISLTVYDMLSDTDTVIKALREKKADCPNAFLTALDTVVGTAAFHTLARGDMEFLIETYKDYLTLPSGYASLSETQRKELYKALETATAEFTDFGDISDFIDDFVNPDNSNGGGANSGLGGTGGLGGGGGISGGLGGAGSVAATAPETETGETVTGGVSPIEEPYFSDLADVAWAEEAIIYLAGRKVISGIGDEQFAPNRNVTREEYVKMLVNAFAIPASETAPSFADVPADAWYAEFIAAAVVSGIVTGESETSFGTGKYITREDMAVMLHRTAVYKNLTLPEKSARAAFADADTISDYAAEAVELLYRNGIINGVEETRFAPKENATRAMAAKLVYELTKISEQ